jgi:NCAIR mutase (PurE)-related protein
MSDYEFDWQRASRTGVAEAVLCGHKSQSQIEDIARQAIDRQQPLLFTRLEPRLFDQLSTDVKNTLDYDPQSSTAILGSQLPAPNKSEALIVTAGTSDMPVALEAQRTLRFNGLQVDIIPDCGVAGLWRLTEKLERLQSAPAIIAVAGMEGALFPVLGGLVPGLVIAVPRSVGYGIAADGKAALGSALASCSPGVVSVNVDNGFGAACALLKVLGHGNRAG